MTYTRFPIVLLKPLRHLCKLIYYIPFQKKNQVFFALHFDIFNIFLLTFEFLYFIIEPKIRKTVLIFIFIFGDIAHLVERYVRNVQVTCSSHAISTNKPPPKTWVVVFVCEVAKREHAPCSAYL